MTERRFTVQWRSQRGAGLAAGWAVFDRNRPITVTWLDEEKALRHRDNIEQLYQRWAW